MSEYQYYEFLAIDRPLTKQQIAEVSQRACAACATPTAPNAPSYNSSTRPH
ncbi:MAG TPA: hypothetical protein VN541_07225 [Tepidisphaeraceae bacterium]|nr:hypothetical protein [Tepidisphaeraceae bacterium]